MIFNDLLLKFNAEIKEEFSRIFNLCCSNQPHEGELLLWFQNGYCEQDNPTIGMSHDVYSELTFNKLFLDYKRSSQSKISFVEFEKINLSLTESKIEENEIQIDMLLYLKFWESTNIIKKLYQLTRILNGEKYDWDFKIAESNRDNNSTGKRDTIIRSLIRDKLKQKSPLLADWMTSIYKSQIRNAIAHSTYYFANRTVVLNNYIEQDKASQIRMIKFSEWHQIFHKLLLLHDELIKFENHVTNYYAEKQQQGEKIYVQVPFNYKEMHSIEMIQRAKNDWIPVQ